MRSPVFVCVCHISNGRILVECTARATHNYAAHEMCVHPQPKRIMETNECGQRSVPKNTGFEMDRQQYNEFTRASLHPFSAECMQQRGEYNRIDIFPDNMQALNCGDRCA